jgi:hypothetical protein
LALLACLTKLNIQRLVYWRSDIAWDAIASHLLFVLRHPAGPRHIRLQAARTLDDIFAIVPRDLMGDLQATVQRRVLDFLAQQIILDRLALSASMELRRLVTLLVGWETIFEVLGSVCQPILSERGFLGLRGRRHVVLRRTGTRDS